MKTEQMLISGISSTVIRNFNGLSNNGWRIVNMVQSSTQVYTYLTLLVEREISNEDL